jgi:hypothetical protein
VSLVRQFSKLKLAVFDAWRIEDSVPGKYSRSNSTKSPSSGVGNVSEPRLDVTIRESALKSCARRSVRSCIQSGGGADIRLLT